MVDKIIRILENHRFAIIKQTESTISQPNNGGVMTTICIISHMLDEAMQFVRPTTHEIQIFRKLNQPMTLALRGCAVLRMFNTGPLYFDA